MPPIKRAIVSVTDKTGLVDLGRFLQKNGVEIISTGGTAKILKEGRVSCRNIADFTGFPEILDGRLKTLHPLVAGGILAVRGNAAHQKEMKENGISPIDLVVVNLYAFEKTIADPHGRLEQALEHIDIGGPTLLRAAAKNYRDVTALCDPNDYAPVCAEMEKNKGMVSQATNLKLALKVFQATAAYDSVIAEYLWPRVYPDQAWPSRFYPRFEKIQDLRYGENPHQSAAFYRELPGWKGSLAEAEQLHGKELSFNNLVDLDAALEIVRAFDEPACAIVKHTNPCGVALASSLHDAFIKAKQGDPLSAFGGIVGLNRTVDEKTAQEIAQTFFECVMAPGYDEEALRILAAKKNIRLMSLNPFQKQEGAERDYKKVGGGLLVQERDQGGVDLKTCRVVTKRKPTAGELAELDFAWRVVKYVKSNAVVFTGNRQLLGLGAGQTSRVDSVKIAVQKMLTVFPSPQGGAPLVSASDAFFPFPDGLEEAAKHGITAVVQPGGSVKDEEIIKVADKHGLAMVFTGMRHFRH